jgi:hypothetical protein
MVPSSGEGLANHKARWRRGSSTPAARPVASGACNATPLLIETHGGERPATSIA